MKNRHAPFGNSKQRRAQAMIPNNNEDLQMSLLLSLSLSLSLSDCGCAGEGFHLLLRPCCYLLMLVERLPAPRSGLDCVYWIQALVQYTTLASSQVMAATLRRCDELRAATTAELGPATKEKLCTRYLVQGRGNQWHHRVRVTQSPKTQQQTTELCDRRI